jgi:hypothetical protein
VPWFVLLSLSPRLIAETAIASELSANCHHDDPGWLVSHNASDAFLEVRAVRVDCGHNDCYIRAVEARILSDRGRLVQEVANDVTDESTVSEDKESTKDSKPMVDFRSYHPDEWNKTSKSQDDGHPWNPGS